MYNIGDMVIYGTDGVIYDDWNNSIDYQILFFDKFFKK